MYRRDTIAALATAPGPAAIAVVRISGDDAEAVARRVFRGRSAEDWESHRMILGRIADAAGRTIDRGLLVVMRAPRSYTGEDVVEIHGHGGIAVSRSVLAAVLRAGARLAERGEFTTRAYLNGRMDLAQAESVADLIHAGTSRAAAVAVEQLEGSLSRAIAAHRERILDVAALLEIAIDFSDEDVPAHDPIELSDRSAAIAAELRALASTYERGRLVRDGVRLAIVGKPNVGKSSLLNALLDTERAIVTPIAGTTRDVIEERFDLEGVAITISDTAGLRATQDDVERLGVVRAEQEIERSDLVLAVFDGSEPWDEGSGRVIAAVRHKPHILVINKDDLPIQLRSEVFEAEGSVHVSAKTFHNLGGLKAAILRAVGLLDASDSGAAIIVRERHLVAVESSAAALERAAAALREGGSPDAVAVDIMTALDHLGEIAGTTSSEDVLDRVFSQFCIGK